MLTLLLCLLAYLVGVNHKLIARALSRACEHLTPELPETHVLPIAPASLPASMPVWAVAGEYLVRDNGRTYNTYLSAYARYLMGDAAECMLLTPAVEMTRVTAITPTGGTYTRVKRTRTLRAWYASYTCDCSVVAKQVRAWKQQTATVAGVMYA